MKILVHSLGEGGYASPAFGGLAPGERGSGGRLREERFKAATDEYVGRLTTETKVTTIFDDPDAARVFLSRLSDDATRQ